MGEGGGVYASNTSPCDTLKRFLCVHSKSPCVYWQQVHMFMETMIRTLAKSRNQSVGYWIDAHLHRSVSGARLQNNT